MQGRAGRVSLSVFNGALFLIMDIARAGPIEPGGHRWLFLIPVLLLIPLNVGMNMARNMMIPWLIKHVLNVFASMLGMSITELVKERVRQPCTAFISLQHILLVSGIVNSMEMIQRSVGMVAGVPLLVFMTMKLHGCTRRILDASQCFIEPVLVIIIVILASLYPVIPARPVQDARSWDDDSGARVVGFTCLLPLLVVLPSGPMGTVGHWWIGRNGMGDEGYERANPIEVVQQVMIRVIIPMVMYVTIFTTQFSSTMPVWAWVMVVLGSVMFGSMDAFGDAASEKAVKDEAPHTQKWQKWRTTEMTWAMFSVIMGLCLARPSMQAECFWIRVGIAAVVAWWEMLFGGRHGGLLFLQAVGSGGHGRNTLMQHRGSQGAGGAKSMFHGVMVDFGIAIASR